MRWIFKSSPLPVQVHPAGMVPSAAFQILLKAAAEEATPFVTGRGFERLETIITRGLMGGITFPEAFVTADPGGDISCAYGNVPPLTRTCRFGSIKKALATRRSLVRT